MVSMELNSFGGDEFHSEVVADQGIRPPLRSRSLIDLHLQGIAN